jgi:phage terminase large subunit-like protein
MEAATTTVTVDRSALAKLPRAAKVEIIQLLEEKERRERQRKFYHYFPDNTHTWRGQIYHARHLYAKHMEFFEAGITYRERCFRAANRVGKTESGGGYEIACHLTGEYPPWWKGRVFDRPIRAWAAGKTNETTRDILQRKLLGKVKYDGQRKIVDGTGVIPGLLLGAPTWKQGVPDMVDTIPVRHAITGEWSTLGLKSYQQGRGSFEGTEQDVIWLDEEPKLDIYGECLIRTATTGGIIMLTFTPLEGMSEVVLQFMPADQRPELSE